jgi:hypothetical protein
MSHAYERRWQRFHHNLTDAKRLVSDYLGGKPYLLTPEEDRKRLRVGWAITLTGAIPDELGPVVGDCIHNLRTTLDNWVYEFSSGSEGQPLTKTGFPVLSNESDWDGGKCCRHDHGAQRVRGLGNRDEPDDPTRAFIRSCQPFSTGPSWMDHIRENLYALNKLDNRDKHMTLNLLTAYVDFPWWSQNEAAGRQRIIGTPFSGLLELNTPQPLLTLQFESQDAFDVGVNTDITLQVVLAEKETQRWEPGQEVIGFLESLSHSVEWVLSSLNGTLQSQIVEQPPGAE